MNVRYRIELSQAERCELTAMLSKGSEPPAAQASPDIAGGRCRPQR